MSRLRIIGIIIGSVLLLSACSSPAGGASTTAPVNSSSPVANADGQPLFATNCASCHGSNGAGGVRLGTVTSPDIRGPALATKYKSDVTLVKQAILNGKGANSKDLDATMPRWSGRLSDAQATAIVQYLLTLK